MWAPHGIPLGYTRGGCEERTGGGVYSAAVRDGDDNGMMMGWEWDECGGAPWGCPPSSRQRFPARFPATNHLSLHPFLLLPILLLLLFLPPPPFHGCLRGLGATGRRLRPVGCCTHREPSGEVPVRAGGVCAEPVPQPAQPLRKAAASAALAAHRLLLCHRAALLRPLGR